MIKQVVRFSAILGTMLLPLMGGCKSGGVGTEQAEDSRSTAEVQAMAEHSEHAGQELEHAGTEMKHGEEAGEHGGGERKHGDGGMEHAGTEMKHGDGEMAHGDGEMAHGDGEMAHGDGEMAHAGEAAAQESGGMEHAGGGMEHAGGGMEHGGHPAHGYTAEEIKKAMAQHIHVETMRNGGVFKIQDPKADALLTLEFVKIHDPVRMIEGRGYFACTDFHPVGSEAGKLYDLDFWLSPKDGALVVTETRIHKHPKQEGAGWVKEARYTFINDNPVEVP